MKRLLKRLLPAVLGMTMLFSITAFAQASEEAKNVYTQMQARSAATDEGNTYCHFNLTMKSGEETAVVAMDMNMLYKNMTQPEQMELVCQYLITMEGQQYPMMMWLKDGYSYVEFMGLKQKSRMDMASAMSVAADPAFLANSADMFSELSVKVEGDKYLLSYQMDEAKLNALMKQTFSQMGLDSLFSSLTFSIHDIKGSYVVTPDFDYDTALISMTLDMSAEGETLSMIMDGYVENMNKGQPVELSFPDFSEFQDISEQTAA